WRIAGQCERAKAGKASTRIPSTPGIPREAFTRFHARRTFAGSRIRVIHSSGKAGFITRRRPPSSPVGFIEGGESAMAPPCRDKFGPSPLRPAGLHSYYGLG